jgi:hypothetical protein
LGLILTVLRFWPQLSIEPTAAAERSNPISGYFKIANEQVHPLTDVGIEVSLRCARIGRPQCTLQSSASKQREQQECRKPLDLESVICQIAGQLSNHVSPSLFGTSALVLTSAFEDVRDGEGM